MNSFRRGADDLLSLRERLVDGTLQVGLGVTASKAGRYDMGGSLADRRAELSKSGSWFVLCPSILRIFRAPSFASWDVGG